MVVLLVNQILRYAEKPTKYSAWLFLHICHDLRHALAVHFLDSLEAYNKLTLQTGREHNNLHAVSTTSARYGARPASETNDANTPSWDFGTQEAAGDTSPSHNRWPFGLLSVSFLSAPAQCWGPHHRQN